MSTPPTDAHADTTHLGPLTTDDSLRGRVVRAAAAALTDARAAQAEAALDPQAAVLAVRKALRQLRALVDLVARTLPKRDRRDLARGLAAARRTLGPARDQAVARTLVDTIAPVHELTAAADAVHAVAEPDRLTPEAILADIERAVAEAASHVDALTAALPDELRPRRVARGLARTYRRARAARKRAKQSDRAVHRWRRRSKELRYQLAIVDALPGAGAWRDALRDLDDQLSPVVDHLMTKDYVRLYGGGSDDATALLTAVHDRLIASKDAARKASRGLFKTRPEKLRDQLTSALAAEAAVDDPGQHDPGDADA
ncbi:MAG: CHAD domain-containing protein [Myxococcales bacterium]|nr:CHAD domain-containing protein [Myxococcales bacterium]